MKFFHIILLMLPLCALSQDKKKNKATGFATLKFEALQFHGADLQPGGSLTFGMRIGLLNLGVGGLITKYGDNTFAPVFFEMSGYNQEAKLSPYAHIRIGVGNYREKIPISNGVIETQGKLYFSPGVGAYIPMKKHGAIISVSYVRTNFETTTKARYIDDLKVTAVEGFAIAIGFKI